MANFPFPSGDLQRAAPLSDEELQELDEFLLSDSTSDETMVRDLSFLVAVPRSQARAAGSQASPAARRAQ